MSKTEKKLPDNTMGGRIRKMRQKENLSQVALYDRAFPYGEAKSNESKARVIRDWEIAGKGLDSQKLLAVCRELKCSSDYLLGLDECTNKTAQFIHDQTGLSEDAIENLLSIAEYEDIDRILALDFLLRSKEFESMLMCLYNIAYCSFTHEYAGLMSGMEDSDMLAAVSHDWEQKGQVMELRLNESFVHIMENFRKEAEEHANHAFNSPYGSSTFEGSVEITKFQFGRVF